jgi:hypothetical protein
MRQRGGETQFLYFFTALFQLRLSVHALRGLRLIFNPRLTLSKFCRQFSLQLINQCFYRDNFRAPVRICSRENKGVK